MTQTKKVLGTAVLFAAISAVQSPAAATDYAENMDFPQRVSIVYSGSGAAVSNGAGSGVSVFQDGADVFIASTVENVEYILSGSSSAGSFAVTGAPACKVTLAGLDLAANYRPALNVSTTNGCYLVLEDGTANALTDGQLYLEDIPGALYSSGPLAISGNGSLILTVRGEEHGIYSPTNISIRSGDISVSGAPKDTLHVGGTFTMDNGSLCLDADSDAIDADRVILNGGSIEILSIPDNIEGIKCDGNMAINGGTVNMIVDGARSKGIDCGGNLEINRGSLSFLMSGDVYLKTITNSTPNYVDPKYCIGVSCSSNLTLNDGTIVVTHTGLAGKGISVDGDMTMNDGKIDIVSRGGTSETFTNEEQDTDLASPDCIKVDGSLTILGGTVSLLNTGNAGDGMTAGGEMIIGIAGITNRPYICAETTGEKVYVSGGGWGEDEDYANPKAARSEGDITINGGTMILATANDGGEGLETKSSLVINGGRIEVTAYDDCIQAASLITIQDGLILCTGTGNGEGIESKGNMIINGGRIEITSGDDSINAMGWLQINDGLIYCYSSDNDAIDSNGSMTINGGIMVASGTDSPEESFDSDVALYVNGGVLIGTAGNVMTQPSSSSSQRVIIYNGSISQGTIVQIQLNGSDALVYEIPRDYSSRSVRDARPAPPGGGGGGTIGSDLYLFFSSSNVTYGASGSILTGGTVSGGTEFHGYHTGAAVSGGSTVKTFTISSVVNNVQ